MPVDRPTEVKVAVIVNDVLHPKLVIASTTANKVFGYTILLKSSGSDESMRFAVFTKLKLRTDFDRNNTLTITKTSRVWRSADNAELLAPSGAVLNPSQLM
ncbi:hypothetical protein pdam_00018143 [Pocillopora damicornis]|uniref:Uncharacterized protein n=1 Tax=Pocillopora damicornis TaxID=46731 RepID=A0A3M6TXY0_POCDA|nr:hypothetical protein pdam_00018143 [Pocillopora damicornis]